MKEQNEYNKQTEIMIDLEAQLNVILRQYLSYTKVAKEFYKFVPKIQPSLLGSTNSNFGKYA